MAHKRIEAFAQAVAKRPRLVVTIASAVLVALAFQGMTMARNNYNLWRLEFMLPEMALALVSSIAANAVKGLDERGRAWARDFAGLDGGLPFRIVSLLPSAAVRGGIMCACLSAINATVIPTVIYRETIGNPVIAVIVRFLADIPQAVFICLMVRLVVDRVVEARGATLDEIQ